MLQFLCSHIKVGWNMGNGTEFSHCVNTQQPFSYAWSAGLQILMVGGVGRQTHPITVKLAVK